MTKSKKIISFLFSITLMLLILSGCAARPGAKAQLTNHNQTVLKDIKAQKKNLAVIKQAMEDNQESFSKEQQDYPNDNLTTVKASNTYKLITKRQKAYAKFKVSQNRLQNDRTELVKISNQAYPNMPKQMLSSLTQSLHLSALDQKTFVTFMDEMQKTEATYYEMLQKNNGQNASSSSSSNTSNSNTQSEDTQEDLDAQENRLNQYYGAIFQQIEIMNVNLNTAQKQAQSLAKKLD